MDRRAAQRRRVLKSASIEFDGGTVECVLRNISETGAALQVDRRVSIPHEFRLTVPHGEIQRNCRVVWRKDALIGLAFDVAA